MARRAGGNPRGQTPQGVQAYSASRHADHGLSRCLRYRCGLAPSVFRNIEVNALGL